MLSIPVLVSDLYVYIDKDGKKIGKTKIKNGLFVMFFTMLPQYRVSEKKTAHIFFAVPMKSSPPHYITFMDSGYFHGTVPFT